MLDQGYEKKVFLYDSGNLFSFLCSEHGFLWSSSNLGGVNSYHLGQQIVLGLEARHLILLFPDFLLSNSYQPHKLVVKTNDDSDEDSNNISSSDIYLSKKHFNAHYLFDLHNNLIW